MKNIRWITFLLVITILINGCSSENKVEPKQENSLDLVKKETLTVCSDVPYPPFEFYSGELVVGLDADLITDIADNMGLHIKFVDTDFKEIFSTLEDKKCDVIASSVSITEEREKLYNFSDPYYEISQSLMVANSNSTILTDLSKFQGKIIGVGTGSTGEAFAIENSEKYGYSVRSFTGLEELLVALKKGDVDAALQDHPINAYESKKSGLTKTTQVFEGREKYGFVVRKESKELLEMINASLNEAMNNGDFDEIKKTYIGE